MRQDQKKILVLLAVFCCTLFFVSSAFSQESSSLQEEQGEGAVESLTENPRALLLERLGNWSAEEYVAEFKLFLTREKSRSNDYELSDFVDINGIPEVSRKEESRAFEDYLRKLLVSKQWRTSEDLPVLNSRGASFEIFLSDQKVIVLYQPSLGWKIPSYELSKIYLAHKELVNKELDNGSGKLSNLVQRYLWNIPGTTWLLFLLAPSLGWFCGVIFSLILRLLVRWRLLDQWGAVDEKVLNPVFRFGGWVVGLLVVWTVFRFAEMPSEVRAPVLIVTKFAVLLAVIVFFYRLCDLIGSILHYYAKGTTNRLDDLVIPLLRRTLKSVIVVMGVLFVAQNFGVEVWSLFAGFSVLGAMVALAGQDTVKNVFGSITVVLDRTFDINDWVVIDGIEGVIEEVGFRSTKIRTFYDSLVTLPNSRMITAHIDNYGRRKYRRFYRLLGIDLGTSPQQIEAFCQGLRDTLTDHPQVRQDSIRVYAHDWNDSAWQILFYLFWKVENYDGELQMRHWFLSEIRRLAELHQVRLSRPARDLQMMPVSEDWVPKVLPKVLSEKPLKDQEV